jgi:hypothetical protein
MLTNSRVSTYSRFREARCILVQCRNTYILKNEASLSSDTLVAILFNIEGHRIGMS